MLIDRVWNSMWHISSSRWSSRSRSLSLWCRFQDRFGDRQINYVHHPPCYGDQVFITLHRVHSCHRLNSLLASVQYLPSFWCIFDILLAVISLADLKLITCYSFPSLRAHTTCSSLTNLFATLTQAWLNEFLISAWYLYLQIRIVSFITAKPRIGQPTQ